MQVVGSISGGRDRLGGEFKIWFLLQAVDAWRCGFPAKMWPAVRQWQNNFMARFGFIFNFRRP